MDVDSNNGDKENTNESNKNASESKKVEDIRYDVELTRAIKENHGQCITEMALCPFEGGEAFMATIGANQVMIYDLEVRGNFISTLLNYRNWDLQTMRSKNVVWKENRENNHPEKLEKKTFSCVCWMKRWRDFYIVAADNEQQIHLISLTYAKCEQIIKVDNNVVEICAHPKYPNVLIAIDVTNKCRFINITTEEIIYTLPDKISQITFGPSGDKFCAVLTNGNIREYTQKVEIVDNESDDEDLKDDEDEDMNKNKNKNRNKNRNSNRNVNVNAKKPKSNKRLIVEPLNVYSGTEDKGDQISDMKYLNDTEIIYGNQDGEFKWINMDSMSLLHQWRVSGIIDKGEVCKFDINKTRDCMVYGNGSHQVQIYDLKNKKYIRRVDTGRGRKLPFSFATFCKNHPQSLMMVCEGIVMKFDPLELVKDYFPSTADFAVQKRNGYKVFHTVKTVEYEVDKQQGIVQ